MEAWFTKFDGDQDKNNMTGHHLFNNEATIVVFRGWGEGVDPIYLFEKRENGEFALNPLDKRFDEFIVYSFEEAALVFIREFCPHEDSSWEVALCMGTRGLTQYLMQTDAAAYWISSIIEKMHSDDTLRMMYLCAEKLGMTMTFESKMETGVVTAYPVEHKLNVNNRPLYLMDMASEVKRSGAIITMTSPNYKKEENPEKKSFWSRLFSRN